MKAADHDGVAKKDDRGNLERAIGTYRRTGLISGFFGV